MMDAVILFSHGSLLCGSGEALLAHAARLRARGVAPVVAVGYLNYSEPPFAATVADVVRQGATRVLVTPYFLVPGKFVRVDLPQAVGAAQAAYPDVEFVVAEAIGYDERLADTLIESARAASGPATWRDDLKRASDHCRANPACPLYATPACPKQPAPPPSKRSEAMA
jgi:sirohydrochlorin ferrochelatase